jgi:NAD(P)-dependent dehydrogenase (short-subunit alcohol dehydrogenase family)
MSGRLHGKRILADPEAAQRLVDWSAEELGGIDVFYKNAATAAYAASPR